jgi:Flp pilus assembly pilin Flp
LIRAVASRTVRDMHPAARALRAFLTDTSGQDVVEYGLLMATVGVAVLLTVNSFGQQYLLPWLTALSTRITTTGV